jgi:hypothetical protein
MHFLCHCPHHQTLDAKPVIVRDFIDVFLTQGLMIESR